MKRGLARSTDGWNDDDRRVMRAIVHRVLWLGTLWLAYVVVHELR